MPTPAARHTDYNRNRRDPVLLELYGTSRWKRFRSRIRAERILCERCSTRERPVVGVEVHHKIDPRVNMELAFEETNVELLCKSCHSSETAKNATRRGQ
ncbi:HNH endonuclease [Singulisphaera sp. GP187]|nr:HNH endonuclease [Singulisphaera sp. GP187]